MKTFSPTWHCHVFRRRPRLCELPAGLQCDMRAFFGTYNKACTEADEVLFRAGNSEAVDQACKESRIGKLLPNALYVHRTAFGSLTPLLRVYEGCARAYLGELPGTNVIKIHRFSGKISYLEYPAFDTAPHPVLARSYKLAMRTQYLDFHTQRPPYTTPIRRHDSNTRPRHPDQFERNMAGT